MTTADKIAAAIQRTRDKKLLRLLNRAWWREHFRQLTDRERKAERGTVRAA